MDKYRIDSHKLIFHPVAVAKWCKGESIFPINMEVCLSGACNHKCIFCGYDYMDYRPHILNKDIFINNLKNLVPLGLKSILLAGTGEPLLHPEAINIINQIKKMRVDVALSTNGVLFTDAVAQSCMESITWIRFSVSAGTERTYKKIHRGHDGDLAKVFKNIGDACRLKIKNGYKTAIGVQLVMIPENINEIEQLATKVKSLGADYFSVKSYGINPLSKNDIKENISDGYYLEQKFALENTLKKLNDNKFRAIYRAERVKHQQSAKNYSECYASPFHANIAADGNVYPCCSMVGIKNMSFGNINEVSFAEIWQGAQRQAVLNFLKDSQLKQCPVACKLDDMNRYLAELCHPSEHVNFI